MELTKADKNRIVLEERYRAEVRTSLDKKPTSGLNAFLNSSFGLWLLSAIFISGAGTIYQSWQKDVEARRVTTQKEADEQKAVFQKRLDEEATAREAIARLDIEISYRLSAALIELSNLEHFVDGKLKPGVGPEERRSELEQVTLNLLRDLGTRGRANRDGLYQDFTNFSLPSLLADLRRRLPEADRQMVEVSLASLASLTGVGSSMGSTNLGGTEPPPWQAASLLHAKVILPRWTRTAFHFIDCSAQNPFC